MDILVMEPAPQAVAFAEFNGLILKMKNVKKFFSFILITVFILAGCVKATENIQIDIKQKLPEFTLLGNYGMFLDNNGDLYTWGLDQRNADPLNAFNYSLGQGTDVLYNNNPTKIYSNIASINFNGVALTRNGEMVEWGALRENDSCVPQITRKGIAKTYVTLYLTQEGELYVKPEKDNAQLTTSYHEKSTLVMSEVLDFVYGYGDFTIKNDGSVWYFMTSAATGEIVKKPQEILDDVVKVCSGILNTEHQLFLKNEGTLWSCGNNEYGQCGNGEHGDLDRRTEDSIVKTPYKMAENVKDAWAFSQTTFFLTKDNKLYACGQNQYDILLAGGNGQMNFDSYPEYIATPVLVMEDVKQIEYSDMAMFVLKTDNTLWTWGFAARGVLGNGIFYDTDNLNLTNLNENIFSDNPLFSQPTQIMENVEQLFTETQGLHFVQKTDSTIWYWGHGSIYADENDKWEDCISWKDSNGNTLSYYKKYYVIPTPIEFSVDTFFQNALNNITTQGIDVSQYSAAAYK